MKRGDIVKLSQKGLDWIYKYNEKGRKRAEQWRFEYRGPAMYDPDCVTVVRLPKMYSQIYHRSFIELA